MVSERETYVRVGWTLLGGLLLSVAVMVLGLILVGITGGTASTVVPLDQVLHQLSLGKAASVLDLGILLLFATPLAGVLVAGIQFLREGDRVFALVTLLLLIVIAIGFAVAVY